MASPILHHIELCKDPLRFSVKGNKVFFDNSNLELVLASQDNMNFIFIPVKGDHRGKEFHTNILCDKRLEKMETIKFSPDHKFICVHEQNKGIEFFYHSNSPQEVKEKKKKVSNFDIILHKPLEHTPQKSEESIKNRSFSYEVKKQLAPLMGFHWIYPDNLCVISHKAIELFIFDRINPKIKLIKEFGVDKISWSIYNPQVRILLTCGGKNGNIINVFQFHPCTCTKIAKFELDGTFILRSNISTHILYNEFHIAYQKESSKEHNKFELLLYKMEYAKDWIVHKTHTYFLSTTETSDCHVLDNLLLVHIKQYKVTMIFDILSPHGESVIPPLPLGMGKHSSNDEFEIYGKYWSFWKNTIIIDAKFGYLWDIHLNLQEISTTFSNKVTLIEFLQRRNNSAPIILNHLKGFISSKLALSNISKIFSLLNACLASVSNTLPENPLTSPLIGGTEFTPISKKKMKRNHSHNHNPNEKNKTHENLLIVDLPILNKKASSTSVITQSMIFEHVFEPLEEDTSLSELDHSYLVAVVLEYIRYLNYNRIEVEHFVYTLLIDDLVKTDRFSQLCQLVQYFVLKDSETVALKLIWLQDKYPTAYQLGLDMLFRLEKYDRIIEVLLTNNDVLSAIRLARRYNLKVDVLRFLEVAYEIENPSLFITVFNFFKNSKQIEDVRFSKFTDYFSLIVSDYDIDISV